MAKTDKPIKRVVCYGLREKAWWVMRRRKTFTLPELLNIVSDGTQKDAEGNLRKYCRALALAGILVASPKRRSGTAITSNGHLEYRVVINSGRKPPVWRSKAQEVYDPNANITYNISRMSEVPDEK